MKLTGVVSGQLYSDRMTMKNKKVTMINLVTFFHIRLLLTIYTDTIVPVCCDILFPRRDSFVDCRRMSRVP